MARERNWDETSLHQLLEALLDHLSSDPADEDDVLGWGLPEDVTNQDAAAFHQAYDDAIDRAFASARRARAKARKDRVQLDRALSLLSAPADRYRPLWRFSPWPLASAYLELSLGARHRCPREMLDHAEEACYHADKAIPKDHPPGLVYDLRAKAWGVLANAYRVNDRLKEAEEALERAVSFSAEGSGDLALYGLLVEWQASLRLDQRRLDDARSSLNEAHRLYLEIGDSHSAARALISLGRLHEAEGRPYEAVSLIERGLLSLDRKQDPALASAAVQILITNLADCGEYRRAGKLILESGLREAFKDQPLNLLRLRWVEARIHAGLNHLDRAGEILLDVRLQLQSHGLEYVAALAGLDLAAIWLRQGEAGRVLPLAIEMCNTFARLELPTQDALAALLFLKVACRKRVASLGLVERTKNFLMRCQFDPTLRFDPEFAFTG